MCSVQEGVCEGVPHQEKCDLFDRISVEISVKFDKLSADLETVQRRLDKLEGDVSQETIVSSAVAIEKEADVLCRVGQLEERMTGVEQKVESSNGFQCVRRGARC